MEQHSLLQAVHPITRSTRCIRAEAAAAHSEYFIEADDTETFACPAFSTCELVFSKSKSESPYTKAPLPPFTKLHDDALPFSSGSALRNTTLSELM
jgi:hypothetical protein